jgi:hypothetical protein
MSSSAGTLDARSPRGSNGLTVGAKDSGIRYSHPRGSQPYRQVIHLTELEASGPAAVPQVLIRVGIGPEGELAPEPTPGRPLNDVLEIRH